MTKYKIIILYQQFDPEKKTWFNCWTDVSYQPISIQKEIFENMMKKPHLFAEPHLITSAEIPLSELLDSKHCEFYNNGRCQTLLNLDNDCTTDNYEECCFFHGEVPEGWIKGIDYE